MENNLLVSIVTPCYNSAKYIGETIESIQAQSYKNWELLITDDCSSDNTVEIVNSYILNDSRIKLFRLDVNKGGGIARNNCIQEAGGRYIAFCDSDDRWDPKKLEKQITFMQNNDYAFSYTSYMTCYGNGEVKGIVVCPRKVTFKSLLRDDKMGCSTIVYDVEKVGKIFFPFIRKRQDWGIARNNCIQEAGGRYIAFCDSDDRWDPKKLEKQITFMQNNDYAFSYTSYMTCYGNGEVKGIVVCPRKVTFKSLLRDDKMGCSTIVYDVERVGKIFFPFIRKRQDWGMKMRILKICKEAYGMKEPLAYYRFTEGSISRNKKKLVKYNIRVYQDVLGWSNLHSMLFFYFLFIPTHFFKKVLIYLYNK